MSFSFKNRLSLNEVIKGISIITLAFEVAFVLSFIQITKVDSSRVYIRKQVNLLIKFRIIITWMSLEIKLIILNNIMVIPFETVLLF